MGRGREKTGRYVAASALERFNPRRQNVRDILCKLLNETDEKQRATDLVLGTVRNLSSIDRVIEKCSGRSVQRIPSRILNVLRVGAYEFVYVPQTGEHAIVNEAVENVKAWASSREAGFVNAVLRQIGRHIRSRNEAILDSNVRRVLPGGQWYGCEFDFDILADPSLEGADYLSAAFSLPRWLVEQWIGWYGWEGARQICFACNRRPSTYLRPNPLRTSAKGLAELLVGCSVEAEVCSEFEMVRVKGSAAVEKLAGFKEGLFTVQDLSSCLAVRQASPGRVERILDLCAAPGVKTTQLAEVTGDECFIVATDVNAKRLSMLNENVRRLGLKSIEIADHEEVFGGKYGLGSFDLVFVDAPCSNTGVPARRVEVRYRIRPDTAKKLAVIQRELLLSAGQMTGPNGRICYSTCSIQKYENELLVKDFVKDSDFQHESEKLTLQSACGFDHDGAYTTVLKRL